jgi:LPXTG-motif cell wall-anchored protein
VTAGPFRPSPSRERAERWELVEAVAVSIMIGLLVAAVWWLVSGVRQVAALPAVGEGAGFSTEIAVEPTSSTTVPSTVAACVGICEPATVATMAAPLPDECLDLGDGAGQTRWGLMPCDPTVGQATQQGGEPLVTRQLIGTVAPPAIPATGAGTTLAAWAVILIVIGLVLIYVRRWRS